MKKFLVLTTVVLSACSTARPPQSGAPTTMPAQTAPSTQTGARAQASTPPQEQAAPEDLGLNDLNAITFSCSKAGLNAAAREAAKAPARGRYQFSYFRLVSDSHDSTYEVHFKSNNYEDPELKYCVSVYCQQGWDPRSVSPTISLMGKAARSKAGAEGAVHVADCGELHPQTAMKHTKKR